MLQNCCVEGFQSDVLVRKGNVCCPIGWNRFELPERIATTAGIKSPPPDMAVSLVFMVLFNLRSVRSAYVERVNGSIGESALRTTNGWGLLSLSFSGLLSDRKSTR